jgi:hypothetical protein
MEAFPGLNNRSSDDAVLLVGPHALVKEAITRGPKFCRARLRRPPTVGNLASLEKINAKRKP